ncbi:MAG: ABC transporter permease [Bacteroidia bacterium]|nr:ABC transporter permease [Bacteroidia bacterium]
MHTLIVILRKEFQQIFRDKAILRIIFMMPIVQLILIPFAADYEVKNITLSVVDHDHSSYSQRLIHKLSASQYFKISHYTPSFAESLREIERDEADLALVIPTDFEKQLLKENQAQLMLSANAIDGVKAGLGSSYATAIVQDFNQEIREELSLMTNTGQIPRIDIRTANWYNPLFNYKLFIVPGILGILVTMVGAFLTALNIVREKEIGTIEQINVTPIKKYQFILGKLIPFWVLGLVSITLGLIISYLVFGLISLGSYLTIYVFAILYLPAVLGFGLLISTFTETQQQATLFAFFFMMIFVLMSGLYTPIESMPGWAKTIAYLSPPTYFVEVIRSVFIKGSSLWDLRRSLLIILGFAVLLNALAVWNYRKRAA